MKTVVIAGASSGIGAAVAREFAKRGMNLCLLARRITLLEALKKELSESFNVKIVICQADVCDRQQIDEAIYQTKQKFGGIDIVIANAAYRVSGDFAQLSVEDFREQFETNVFGVLQTIYASLEDLKKSRGYLAIVGSVGSYVAVPGLAPYSMSKFALRALTDSIRGEMAQHGISVTLICPGYVQTQRILEHQNLSVPSYFSITETQAAKQIVSAILKRKKEEVISFPGKLGVLIKRYFPSLSDLLIQKFIRVKIVDTSDGL